MSSHLRGEIRLLQKWLRELAPEDWQKYPFWREVMNHILEFERNEPETVKTERVQPNAEEIIIYDAMQAIMDNAKALCDLVNRCGSPEEKRAYRDGVYSPAIKLQVVLGSDGMERGEKRYNEMCERIKLAVASEQSLPPNAHKIRRRARVTPAKHHKPTSRPLVLNLSEIVTLELQKMGCDALFLCDDDTCGCKIGDLFTCGQVSKECEPAIWYKDKAYPINRCQCKNCGSKERLDVIRDRGHVSCCPDREMIPDDVAELNAIFDKPNAQITGPKAPVQRLVGRFYNCPICLMKMNDSDGGCIRHDVEEINQFIDRIRIAWEDIKRAVESCDSGVGLFVKNRINDWESHMFLGHNPPNAKDQTAGALPDRKA